MNAFTLRILSAIVLAPSLYRERKNHIKMFNKKPAGRDA